jgi:flagellar biosynthesis activator protein FlaF
MSLQAYQKTQRQSETPRDTEYRLFGQVTHALIEADKASRSDFLRLTDALDWNRRLWSTLATDCASEGNQLPRNVRAQIISLSIWVSRFSSEVVRSRGSLEPLIEVNRAIMQGLAPRSAA